MNVIFRLSVYRDILGAKTLHERGRLASTELPAPLLPISGWPLHQKDNLGVVPDVLDYNSHNAMKNHKLP